MDTYRYKKRDFSRIKLKFSNSLGRQLNIWEIENLLGRFASLYYKVDLLHTLSIELNRNNDLSNLLISNNEISYSVLPGISRFKRKKELHFLYKSQFTLSYFENLEHKSNEIIFEFFNLLNSTLHKLDKQTLYIRELDKYLVESSKNGLNIALKSLERDALKRDGGTNVDFFKSLCKNHILKYLDDFNSMERRMKGPFYKSEKNVNYFFNSFNTLSKPVIGIYNPKAKEYQVIGHQHFKGADQIQYFDVKSITHESPTLFSIEVSPELLYGFFAALAAGATLTLKMAHNYYKAKRDKKEIDQIDQNNKEETHLNEHRQQLKEAVEKYSLLDSRYKEKIESRVNDVENESFKNYLNDSLSIISNEFEFLIKDFSIDVKEIE